MRVRSLLPPAAVVAAALAVLGCGGPPATVNRPEANQASGDANPDVGAALYPAKPDVKIPTAATTGGEPIVISGASVQFDIRQQVAAEVDGRIELIAVRDDAIAPTDPAVVYHPRDVNKQVKYRLLKDGDPVRAGEVICSLNDELVQARKTAAAKAKESAASVQSSATEGVKLSRQKADITEKAWKNASGSFADFLQDMITLTRFEENLAQAKQTIAKAESDYTEADVMLKKHMVSSAVNGFIRTISQHPGQVVKTGEKIMEIQATDVVRLEGNLDVQYAAFVKRGMAVTVEPATPIAPFRTLVAQHRLEVTAVAVTAHPNRPLVVSTAADGSARVWDVTKTGAVTSLPHPVPVRSVACSPAGAKTVLAVTGADDGKVRVWDLSDPDKIPTAPRDPADAHAAAVGAVAFSPDGRFFATAAGRDVFVWDAAEGKKLYALPAEHRDAVTSLSFTPQGTLVTASKDRSLKVWKLGAERAGIAKTIDHRAAAVDVLGVTADGGRVVFDQDKNRLDLVSLADKQTVGQVQNTGATATFATLAVFSPDDSLLLTAGGEGELKGGLQVWNVPPAGGRGAEVARLYTPARTGVTAAAFSPVKEQPFLAVGTTAGTVHLWKPPSVAALKTYTGKVVNVDATDPRYVTVRVEMSNKELNLLDRSSATIIINPGQ